MKELISKAEFGGERPLYCRHGLSLEDVVIHAGESALKETSDIEAVRCRFEGKYPFWCCNGFTVKDCLFTEGARAALWYSSNLVMEDCVIDAPKMFREMNGMQVRRIRLSNALETFWNCRDLDLQDAIVSKGDYIFMHSRDLRISGLRLQGNYSFQYTKNVEIRNSIMDTKDAFWETENVRVYDSVISGEYLGWYSKGLRLVNCRIGGTQPLCYAEDLVLENCTFDPDADLAFEYSSVRADIRGAVTSVKNPRTGSIVADSYGDIILDSNIKAPGDCRILTRNDL